MSRLIKRLRLAWRFKVWPWAIPASVVTWIALDQRLTERDIRRTRELAIKYGWEAPRDE